MNYQIHIPHTPQSVPLRGFTLVETLVAVSILLVVIIGPMTIAQKGMWQGMFASEQTTAVFLAQESIDTIKKFRDDTALAVLDDPALGETYEWTTTLLNDCFTARGCDYNRMSNNFRSCSPSPISSCLLKQDLNSTTRVYGYSGTNSSIYTRRIWIGTPLSSSGVEYAWPVTVKVEWESAHYGPKSVTLQTWLYDQYKEAP